MKQKNNGFGEFQVQKALKDREHWQKMKKRGHLPYLAMCIGVVLGTFAFIDLIDFLCLRLGWLHSSPSTSWVDQLLIAVAIGASIGQTNWSNMKRRFGKLPPDKELSTN
jgi:hypothetical protein